MMIQCGVENNLSILGDTLFRLPGRQIFIVNYNIDLTRREIILKGSCSSKTMPRMKALQCTLKFAAEYSIGLRAETGVYEDEDSYDMVYESYSLAKINDRSCYSFFSPSLISVRSSPPKNERKILARCEDMDPCPYFLSSYSPKGRGLLEGEVGIIVQQKKGMSRLSL